MEDDAATPPLFGLRDPSPGVTIQAQASFDAEGVEITPHGPRPVDFSTNSLDTTATTISYDNSVNFTTIKTEENQNWASNAGPQPDEPGVAPKPDFKLHVATIGDLPKELQKVRQRKKFLLLINF